MPKNQNVVTTKNNDTDHQYTPLLDRMTSWWNGDAGKQVVSKAVEKTDKSLEIHVNADNFTTERWTDLRVQILEILWGSGNRIPGDHAFNSRVFQTGLLNSKSKVLDLAGGFGKCATDVAKESFANVDIIESYQQLLPYINKTIKRTDAKLFVSLFEDNLNNVKLPRSKYDLVYGREILFKHKHKQNILEKCVDSLAPTGHFIFTDFVLEKNSTSYDIFKNWSKHELGEVHPVSENIYRNIFASFEMKFYHPTDISKEYIHNVNNGWARLKDFLTENKVDDEFVDIMIQESELWLSRVRALQSGKLKLLQFHACW